jgi:hypothetical protein
VLDAVVEEKDRGDGVSGLLVAVQEHVAASDRERIRRRQVTEIRPGLVIVPLVDGPGEGRPEQIFVAGAAAEPAEQSRQPVMERHCLPVRDPDRLAHRSASTL